MPSDYFLQFCTKPMVQMRLFHYPPQPPVTEDKAFGVAPHSDYGAITLLSQDPIGGLECPVVDDYDLDRSVRLSKEGLDRLLDVLR